jgi:hypothetical protein
MHTGNTHFYIGDADIGIDKIEIKITIFNTDIGRVRVGRGIFQRVGITCI